MKRNQIFVFGISRKRSVDKINAFIKILIYGAAPLRSIGSQQITYIQTFMEHRHALLMKTTHAYPHPSALNALVDSPLLLAG